MKRKVILTFTMLLATAFLSGCGVKQLKTSVTVEAGDELNLKATEILDIKESEASNVTFDVSNVDTNTVGTYEAVATYNKKEYKIEVVVEDTTAPEVTFSQRVLFANDVTACDIEQSIEAIYEVSEYEAQFVRFEKTGELMVMDEAAVNSLSEEIPVPCDQDKMKELGTEEVPTEEGIYKAVLLFKDAYDNEVYEQVYLVLDQTGAKIEEVPDTVVTVSEEQLSDEPEINKEDYSITDNVDGVIKTEDMLFELSVKDEENHEWLVKVSYTDRSGNDSFAEFLITVKEDVAENQTSTSGSSGSSTGGSNTNTSSGTTASNTSGGSYHPADTNKDGNLDEDELYAWISPDQQAMIDAGYGNVVALPSGGYGVLVHADGTANGKQGFEILGEYLESQGLTSQTSFGGAIRRENDWYGDCVTDIVPIDTSWNEW